MQQGDNGKVLAEGVGSAVAWGLSQMRLLWLSTRRSRAHALHTRESHIMQTRLFEVNIDYIKSYYYNIFNIYLYLMVYQPQIDYRQSLKIVKYNGWTYLAIPSRQPKYLYFAPGLKIILSELKQSTCGAVWLRH